MNWFEADEGFLVNLDKVKAIQKNGDYTSTIFFDFGDVLDSVTCNMAYESLKGLLALRNDRQEEIQKNLRSIAHGQTAFAG